MKSIINNLVNSPPWVGYIPHIMNIFFYHKQNPSTDVNQDAFSYNKLYVDNVLANIKFVGNRFPNSKIFLIEEGLNASSNWANFSSLLNLPNLTIIKRHENLSRRHRGFLENYFHFFPDANREFLLLCYDRWFYIYESLVSNGIENFVSLDSDCLLLGDLSSHDFEKIGINHPPCSEDCWPNVVMCSTTNLNKFLDFMCSFYEGVQAQKDKAKYINSFFDKPRTDVCDMSLWYLFKKQNPDLFVNNLTLGPDDSIHDLGLGYEPNRRVNDPSEYHEFTKRAAPKRDPQGNLETHQIKQIFYTEDGPCFEEKDTSKLIKIKSLHFTPGTLKFDIIPFIEEYEKIYGFPH